MSVIACSKVIFSFPQVNSAVVFSQDLRSRCSNVRARSEPLKQRLISGLSLTCESRSMVDFWILRRIHSVNAPQAGPRWLLLEEEGGLLGYGAEAPSTVVDFQHTTGQPRWVVACMLCSVKSTLFW